VRLEDVAGRVRTIVYAKGCAGCREKAITASQSSVPPQWGWRPRAEGDTGPMGYAENGEEDGQDREDEKWGEHDL